MNNKIGLAFATAIESKPFISNLSFIEIEKKPFKVYNKDQQYLIVSGIGKANAAMATSYLIYKYDVSKIFNIGAAGATTIDNKVGDIYHIDSVVEYDRPRLAGKGKRIKNPDVLPDFVTATLCTQDRPITAISEREKISKYADIVDMEGASVIHACRLWNIKCYLFKIITDTPENERTDIVENMIKTSNKMYEFISRYVLSSL